MILVTGSTGNIGSLLVQKLLQHNATVRALMRDPEKEKSKSDSLRAQGVEIAQGDLARPDSLPAALQGVESVFLLTPVTQETLPWKRNLINAAKAADVRHVVNLSVSGAASDAPFVLGRWHWQAEQELEATGLPFTHLRPTDLGRYATMGFLPSAREQGAIYSTIGTGRVAMVDEADVADVAAHVLTAPGDHAQQTYHLTGPEALSYLDVADLLSTALAKKISYVNVTREQATASMLQMGLPMWVVDFINDLREMESKDLASRISNDIPRITGHPATPYAETVRTVLDLE